MTDGARVPNIDLIIERRRSAKRAPSLYFQGRWMRTPGEARSDLIRSEESLEEDLCAKRQ